MGKQSHCAVGGNDVLLMGCLPVQACIDLFVLYRLSSSEDNVKMLLTLRPFFRLLHKVSADGPEEDHQLMGCTFQAAQIAITLPSLNYMRWRRAIDETPGLEFFKLALQVNIVALVPFYLCR